MAGISTSSSTSTSRWIQKRPRPSRSAAARPDSPGPWARSSAGPSTASVREPAGAQRGDVLGLLRVARAEHDDLPGRGARPARGLHPRLRPEPEGDAHRHVRRLAGRGAAAVVDVDVAVDVGDAERRRRRRAARRARPGPARSSRRARAAARRRRPRRAPRRGRPASHRAPRRRPTTPVAGSRTSERMWTSRSPRSVAPMRSTRPCARTAAGASSVPPSWPTESIGTPMTVHGLMRAGAAARSARRRRRAARPARSRAPPPRRAGRRPCRSRRAARGA